MADKKRAVSSESTGRNERAIGKESPDTTERAGVEEPTVSDERADTRPELTVLVLLRDQLQKLRIAEGNRAAASEKLEEPSRTELHRRYEKRIFELEHEIETGVRDEMRQHPAWPWLKGIRGVGELSAALVCGYIDIARAPTVSALWRYCGYGVVDGSRERPTKGERLHYNARVKTMVWRLIDLQVKLRGPYRKVYDDAKRTYMTTRMQAIGLETPEGPERAVYEETTIDKERALGTETTEIDERAVVLESSTAEERARRFESPGPDERAIPHELPDPRERAIVQESSTPKERADHSESPVVQERAWTLGHCEQAARRKAAKLFLSHLWQVWREAEGLPVGEPFIPRSPGHDVIGPWQFIEDNG